MRDAFRSQSANPANSPNTSPPPSPSPALLHFSSCVCTCTPLLRTFTTCLSQPDIFENQPTPTSLVIDRRPPAVTLVIVSRNLTTLRFPPSRPSPSLQLVTNCQLLRQDRIFTDLIDLLKTSPANLLTPPSNYRDLIKGLGACATVL
jgi:hypothetical protein